MATTNPEEDKSKKPETPQANAGTQQGGKNAGNTQGGQGGRSTDNPQDGRNTNHDIGNERSVAGREDS